MMNSKLAKIGLIGGAIGTVIGGVGAIVAECRRHKTKKKLQEAEEVLVTYEVENVVNRARIRKLQKENAKLKSERKENES
jgi:uncharacterized membrane protein YsdA (DUF1294 family)